MTEKASAEDIQRRFDADVESFSNLETGQTAIMDAPLLLELVSACAAVATPQATRMLDIGCGAGNYALKILGKLPSLDVTLLDLSAPMLKRARERVAEATSGNVDTRQSDIREVELGEGGYDIIVAAASLHHLRGDDEWRHVFGKLYRALRPGGALWIADIVEQVHPAIQALVWARYGDYLVELGGADHRDHVFEQMELNDSPRSLEFQATVLYDAGFGHVDIVHKNGPFAAFAALK